MEKRKRWHSALIIIVIALTIYNILPTVFYYSKPLNKPVTKEKALQIGASSLERVNALKDWDLQWLKSYLKLLKIKSSSIEVDAQQPQYINLSFNSKKDADLFKQYFPRAGALIPFLPAQMGLAQDNDNFSTKVLIQRNIPYSFSQSEASKYFDYATKIDASGKTSPLYRKVIEDRLLQLGLGAGGITENAQYLQSAIETMGDPRSEEFLTLLTQNINRIAKAFGESSPLAKKFYATFTQGNFSNRSSDFDKFISALESLKDKIKLEKISLQEKEKSLKESQEYLTSVQQQRLDFLSQRENKISSALSIAKKNALDFKRGPKPWNDASLRQILNESPTDNGKQTLYIDSLNPIFDKAVLDWNNDTVALILHKDISEYRQALENDRSQAYKRDLIDQILIDEVARLSRETGEEIHPSTEGYQIALNKLSNSTGVLVFDLGDIAQKRAQQLLSAIREKWNPKHPDLNQKLFPIVDQAAFRQLSPKDQKLALVVYAPGAESTLPMQGFRMGSIYVIAKGLDELLGKVYASPQSPSSQQFIEDIQSLQALLKSSGFIGYPGTTYPLPVSFSRDYIFEAEDFYLPLLKATREEFNVQGTKRFAVLELTNLEQRLLTLNRIETQMHEDLLKWRDEYNASRVDPTGQRLFDVPKPTKNVLLNNLALSFKKYFRGDERKILHWGLDLSGGKTVQIELRDVNNKLVTNEMDINQAINELYQRVNKMGVSEVSIRQEGSSISLDFPGSQAFSAAELVKASSMFFHVVNEKFTPHNPHLSEAVSRFLQEIWNEAVVTNKKDPESINLIAWNHLYGDSTNPENVQPRSEAAKILYDQGLRLAHPKEDITTSAFNDTVSKIALFRGSSFVDWQGQTHPLLIVFKNYTLEGSSLENVRSSYDASKGNFLSFEIKGSQTLTNGQKLNPRADLYAWTSTFSKEKVSGTPLAEYSKGSGWRMAIILNGTIISSPPLESTLKDSAMITGSFTQREINKLEADLKAGSLSFSPTILSEKNVSPELGIKERFQGIMSTIVALLFVVAMMIAYYRFAGVVASIAVLFNLLIMWAALQNISATLTLATLAGVILTMGMAVDANVLVFERIREEFAQSGRIASALQAGYRKAFSAIFDSNITTIIAAAILLHFDSGPIKGFAITLIIGILSSMFTALFMTRYFFSGWVKNPKHKTLNMKNWIKSSSFDFLKWSKLCFIISGVIALAGAFYIYKQKNTLMGMDFTGGFALNMVVEKRTDDNYRRAIEQALEKSGASRHDYQVRELTPSNNVRVFFGKGMEEKNSPFFGMPLEIQDADAVYGYQNNPRIVWVVDALQKQGIGLSEQSLKELDKNWTSISGQMSEAMRNNAIFGLSLALLCILIYITIRFEFKYAVAATLGLGADVILTLSVVGILHTLKVPLQIDLNIIAALMTIIGYSLNDTIIVFDRIREDMRKTKRASIYEIVNHSLNVTLSRTIMTSGTTLAALVALVALGGSTIFGFALVMSIGVIIGTLSSLFISSPIMLFFHKREDLKKVSIN